jgi:hypothetical protein
MKNHKPCTLGYIGYTSNRRECLTYMWCSEPISTNLSAPEIQTVWCEYFTHVAGLLKQRIGHCSACSHTCRHINAPKQDSASRPLCSNGPRPWHNHLIYLYNLNHTLAGPSGRMVWDGDLDRLDAETVGRIPLKTWMVVLVFLCCAVLWR